MAELREKIARYLANAEMTSEWQDTDYILAIIKEAIGKAKLSDGEIKAIVLQHYDNYKGELPLILTIYFEDAFKVAQAQLDAINKLLD